MIVKIKKEHVEHDLPGLFQKPFSHCDDSNSRSHHFSSLMKENLALQLKCSNLYEMYIVSWILQVQIRVKLPVSSV